MNIVFSRRIQLDSGGRVLTPYLTIDYREWSPDPQSTDTIRVSLHHHDITGNDVIASAGWVFGAVLARRLVVQYHSLSVCCCHGNIGRRGLWIAFERIPPANW